MYCKMFTPIGCVIVIVVNQEGKIFKFWLNSLGVLVVKLVQLHKRYCGNKRKLVSSLQSLFNRCPSFWLQFTFSFGAIVMLNNKYSKCGCYFCSCLVTPITFIHKSYVKTCQKIQPPSLILGHAQVILTVGLLCSELSQYKKYCTLM